tara:strand:- start:989 stop:1177 length:189 start_codon:yes stop_codon:yes gene_type:complete
MINVMEHYMDKVVKNMAEGYKHKGKSLHWIDSNDGKRSKLFQETAIAYKLQRSSNLVLAFTL